MLVKETDQRFKRILKIIKDRETRHLPIYFPYAKLKKLLGNNQVRSLVWVEKNLEKGKYTHRPWKFIRDVNKVFEVILSNCSKRTKMHEVASEVGIKDWKRSSPDFVTF